MPFEMDPSVDLPLGVLLLAAMAMGILILALHLRLIRQRGRLSAYSLIALRLVILGTLLFMLGGYVLRQDKTELPDLVIIIDDSSSMLVVDSYREIAVERAVKKLLRSASLSEASRLNIAKAILVGHRKTLLERLSKKFQLRLYYAARTARPREGDIDQLQAEIQKIAINAPIDEDLSPLADAPKEKREENASRLGDTLQVILQAQRGRSTAAILILSDGRATEGASLESAAAEALVQKIPLYFVAIGVDSPPHDLHLSDVRSEETVYLGDAIKIYFQITANGYLGKTATVRLFDENNPADLLAETTILLNKEGAPNNGVLRLPPLQRGRFNYRVEVAPLEGEASLENNDRSGSIDVIDKHINVLLVQDAPNYEFRYLKALFRPSSRLGEDSTTRSTIHLHSVLQQADLPYVETDASARSLFPLSREDLFSYDVILFGDVNPGLLGHDALKNLYDFVNERGGGLLFIAGPRYMPWAYRGTPIEPLLPFAIDEAILPDDKEGATIPIAARPTPYGLTTPPLQWEESNEASLERWNKAAPLYWMLQLPLLKAGARPLLENQHSFGIHGKPLPIITSQYIGAGEVVFHATDESWRWRWRGGKEYYAHYWRQQIRQLSRASLHDPQKSIQISTDRQEYQRGDVVKIRVRFLDLVKAPARDQNVIIQLERKGQTSQSLLLERVEDKRGVYEGERNGLPVGEYSMRLLAPLSAGQAHFVIQSPPGEMANIQVDSLAMQRASQRSGGRYYSLDKVRSLMGDLPQGERVVLESRPGLPLWNHPLLMFWMIGLLITDWIIRKRWGMA